MQEFINFGSVIHQLGIHELIELINNELIKQKTQILTHTHTYIEAQDPSVIQSQHKNIKVYDRYKIKI